MNRVKGPKGKVKLIEDWQLGVVAWAVGNVMKNIHRLNLQREPICYQASEAVYYLCSKKFVKPMRIKMKGESHWFLQGPHGEVFDLTAGQFKKLPAYSKAKGAAFFPRRSALAEKLMYGPK